MYELGKDLRHAARGLARRPGITALAVLSLALGIGVNSSIFTLVNAVLLRDPPARQPKQLVEVYTQDSGGFKYATSSYPDFADLRRQTTSFSDLAAYSTTIGSYDDGERTELLFGELVSGNYFPMLGLQPELGRWFLPEEDATPGSHPVLVLSHAFWQQRFAGDPAVLGKTLKLNGHIFTVVGVAPETMASSVPGLQASFWAPMMMMDAMSDRPRLERRGGRGLLLRGRLKPDVTLEQAQEEMSALFAGLAEAYPDTNADRGLTLVPSSKVVLNPGIDGPLFGVAAVLMVIVALVLLIACSNIANLLLARAADRRKEIAIRLALGSSRARLMRQLLSESLLLAVLGGALGLLFALWTARLIVSFRPPLPVPLALDLNPDAKVLGFTLLLAVATGLVCGLAPALQASRPRLVPALKDEASSLGRGYRRFGLRNLLVVSQVAISTLLLIGAGLFLRSLASAQAIDPGFSLRSGAVAQVAPGFGGGYTPEQTREIYRQMLERARTLPGARSAALAEFLPLGLSSQSRGVQLEGQALVDKKDQPEVDTIAISTGYFATMGIDLPWGRDFTDHEQEGGPGVVILNETAAQRFWPGESPLGKRLSFNSGTDWLEVVGVAKDGKYQTLGEEPKPFIYSNLAQGESPIMTLVVAGDDQAALLGQVRAALVALDPHLPILDLHTMEEHLAIMLFPARLGAALLAAFGVLGLVLASVGLYGVVAYAVSRRTREMGIRIALGAGGSNVLRLVVREGMALVATGIGIGLLLALVATRALDKLLFGITATDPVTFVAVPLVLATVALLANLGPALRATRVDPMVALRYD